MIVSSVVFEMISYGWKGDVGIYLLDIPAETFRIDFIRRY